jgi:hypothetical protein
MKLGFVEIGGFGAAVCASGAWSARDEMRLSRWVAGRADSSSAAARRSVSGSCSCSCFTVMGGSRERERTAAAPSASVSRARVGHVGGSSSVLVALPLPLGGQCRRETEGDAVSGRGQAGDEEEAERGGFWGLGSVMKPGVDVLRTRALAGCGKSGQGGGKVCDEKCNAWANPSLPSAMPPSSRPMIDGLGALPDIATLTISGRQMMGFGETYDDGCGCTLYSYPSDRSPSSLFILPSRFRPS